MVWRYAIGPMVLAGCSAANLNYLDDGRRADAGGTDGSADVAAGDASNGSDASGASDATTDAPKLPQVVTIAGGRGSGPISWAGTVAGGTTNGGNQGPQLTTFSTPTCSGGGPVTGNGTQCPSLVWSTTDSLCISGNVPPLACDDAGNCNYGDDWGALVELTAPLGSHFDTAAQSVAIEYTGTPPAAIRLQVIVGGSTYCAIGSSGSYTSGEVVPLSSFNATCWAPTTGGGVGAFNGLTSIGIEIVSSATEIPFDLCLKNITFN